jgi:hypothetical protein
MEEELKRLDFEYELMVRWLPAEEKYTLFLENNNVPLEKKEKMIEEFKTAKLKKRYILLIPGTSWALYQKYFILVC